MQLDCPNCGNRVFAQDVGEAHACPKCGCPFGREEIKERERKPIVPTVFLWVLLLLGPGLLTLGLALPMSYGQDYGRFPPVLCGSVLAFAISLWIGLRRRGHWPRVLMTLVAFVIALVVGFFVFFAGCLASLGRSH